MGDVGFRPGWDGHPLPEKTDPAHSLAYMYVLRPQV
jgi:hypothetical protein